MNLSPNGPEAFLEDVEGGRTPLGASCAIGRVAGNEIVIDGDRVSRRHAVIHRREAGEYWLMDLGSRNGTFLNRRRLLQPAKLSDGDEIEIGGRSFRFHQATRPGAASAGSAAPETIREVQSIACWLLVADMENSTRFITRTSPRQFAERTQQWLAHCREIIERHDGAINKFLGDGFFAYWRHTPDATRQVAGTLEELRRLPATDAPQFRLALHFGTVVAGGGATLGEESLMGPEVHFVFRLEKLAATLAKSSVVSATAAGHITRLLPLEALGAHHLHGFDGEHLCYTLSEAAPFQGPPQPGC